jgi:alpha-1,2-glucosyltransferase
LNVVATCLIFLQSYDILQSIHGLRLFTQRTKGAANSQVVWDIAHQALNISLFPPLFFFSGLFYTDVMSTLLVLMSYSAFLKRRAGELSPIDGVKAVISGMAALSFRQTNIFWVAIFPAGLAVLEALQTSREPSTKGDVAEILRASWDKGTVHNPSVASASLLGQSSLAKIFGCTTRKAVPVT